MIQLDELVEDYGQYSFGDFSSDNLSFEAEAGTPHLHHRGDPGTVHLGPSDGPCTCDLRDPRSTLAIDFHENEAQLMKWEKRNPRIPHLAFLAICLAIALLVRELHQSFWVGMAIVLAVASLADFLEMYRLDTNNRNQDKGDR